MQIKSLLPRVFRPQVYQGSRRPSNYFEGWYFKLVDAAGKEIWSVIPGVSYSDDNHCFVQVIHANSGKSHYIRYPVGSFRASRKELGLQVGPNRFDSGSMELNLENKELSISGSIRMKNTVPFPSSAFSPGIMGWYSYVPFMECYHGVVSMQHDLAGTLSINGNDVSFDGGKGYNEKDWGKSMPSDWIWIQSNHFAGDETASFMVSLARIPWLNGFFPGFLSFLRTGGGLYRFATYNGSAVQRCAVDDRHVEVVLKNSKYQLKINVMRLEGGVLKAPRHGSMDREIRESIVSTAVVELKRDTGEVLFADRGRFTGLEIVGEMETYFRDND